MSELPGTPPGIGTARILGLLTVTGVLAGGQLLFKIAADRLVLGQGITTLGRSLLSLPMMAALALYGAATLLWVYLLQGLPLSRAYPFVALAFAVVPLLSWIVFRDELGPRYVLGLALMLAGLYFVATTR